MPKRVREQIMSVRSLAAQASIVLSVSTVAYAAPTVDGPKTLKQSGATPVAVAFGPEATIDNNLGTLGAGTYSLTGTTVGASNDIDTYTPNGNPAAIWDQDVIYQFTTASPFTVSFTSNDPDSATNDNDFWLLNSTTTTINSNGLRSATQIGPSAFISGSYGVQPAGTYYFVVDAWRGNPTTSGTPAAGRATSFAVNLSLLGAPSVLFTGNLASTDPTFVRPLASGTAGSTTVFYDVTPFYVTTAGTYSIEQTSGFDDYMFIYANAFNPLTPTANFVEGDDDDGAGNDSLITRALTPGVQYYLVNTSFGTGITGAYTVTQNGPVPIVVGLIPEPTTLGALAAAGLILGRRRR
jgi:hypothetical protein